MKRLLTAALCAAFCAAAAAQAVPDTLRVLAIGNSFSTDALHDYLHEIAEADGQHIIIGNMYIGGCKLDRHWANARSGEAAYLYEKQLADGTRDDRKGQSLEAGITDEPWDVITMQQGGGLYGIMDSYYPDIDSLKAYVLSKATNPGVKLGVHQTWALPANSVKTNYVPKFYDGDSGKMYRMNVETARKVQEKSGFDFVIPTGTAIQNLRGYMGDNVWRDGHHLSYTIGRYTAALTWYEALTGRSVEGNTFAPDHVLDYNREMAQKCAHAAVASPDAATRLYEKPHAITTEQEVPAYTLPDPLVTRKGRKVRTVRAWERRRRPELLGIFRDEVYGKMPQPSPDQHYEVLYEDTIALGGIATRKEVRIYFTADTAAYLTMMLYTPNDAKGPVPAFLGVNFKGNWGTCLEEGVLIPPTNRNGHHQVIENLERGTNASRWPYEMILEAGYAVATYYRGDTSPDTYNGHNNPLHKAFYREGQNYPDPDEWGTIGAWAWGLSRCLDYLETDSAVDAAKVAVFGHSRLGKTALWAGATDPRFAMVYSNCSGCGGAALSRRRFGETVYVINRSFNHWFCDNFKKYNDDETALPVDQHELMALIAPRPLYVVSATADGWADPHGEFISACEASRVYNLYGLKGLVGADGREVTEAAASGSVCLSDPTVETISSLPVDTSKVVEGLASAGLTVDLSTGQVPSRRPLKGAALVEALKYAPMPAPDQPLLEGNVGYHIHTGKHDINSYDWAQYIKFADKYLK